MRSTVQRLTVLVSLYMFVFGSPGLPRMAGMSFGSLTTTKFLNGTLNLHAQVLSLSTACSALLIVCRVHFACFVAGVSN